MAADARAWRIMANPHGYLTATELPMRRLASIAALI
ncbi:hypothetical protein KC8_18420 [Sphingomonas sp. KC8]|nr:hypothetical protein KC8_18420 [Sphingomonas sp. KC8]